MNFKYLFNRILDLSIVLIGVSIIVFSMIRVIPGDAVAIMLGANTEITQEGMNELRSRLGLDKSILEQYFIWIINIFKGDFGTSIWTGRPVISEIYINAWPTIELTALSVIIGASLSIPIGCFMAISRGSFSEIIIRVTAIAGLTIPSFWLGIVSILLVAKFYPSFIALGYVPFFESPSENLKRMI